VRKCFLKDFLISLPVARLGYFFRNPNRLKNQLRKLHIVSRMKSAVLSAARPSYILQYGKMASTPELASCVIAFHETKSVVTVQRQFRERYWKIPCARLMTKFSVTCGRTLNIVLMLL